MFLKFLRVYVLGQRTSVLPFGGDLHSDLDQEYYFFLACLQYVK